VERNEEEAMFWFRKASQQEYIHSMYNLGSMLYSQKNSKNHKVKFGNGTYNSGHSSSISNLIYKSKEQINLLQSWLKNRLNLFYLKYSYFQKIYDYSYSLINKYDDKNKVNGDQNNKNNKKSNRYNNGILYNDIQHNNDEENRILKEALHWLHKAAATGSYHAQIKLEQHYLQTGEKDIYSEKYKLKFKGIDIQNEPIYEFVPKEEL